MNRDSADKQRLEKRTFFDIYQRPTINYKLECEAMGVSRSEAIRILTENPSIETASEYEITEDDVPAFKLIILYALWYLKYGI